MLSTCKKYKVRNICLIPFPIRVINTMLEIKNKTQILLVTIINTIYFHFMTAIYCFLKKNIFYHKNWKERWFLMYIKKNWNQQ